MKMIDRAARTGILVVGLAAMMGGFAMIHATTRVESEALNRRLTELANKLDATTRALSALRRSLIADPGDIIRVDGIGYIQITDPNDLIQRILTEGRIHEMVRLDVSTSVGFRS
jgi:hypothetical protein